MAKRGRPPKTPIAYDAEEVKKFVERLFEIEKEILTLREDKAELKEEFKEKIDFKLINKVIQLVKTKVRLEMNSNASEQTIEEIENLVRDNIGKVLS